MSTITTIVPMFMNGHIDEKVFEFETLEDLLELSCVKVFRTNTRDEIDTYFHQYSLNHDILMVESFGGNYSHAIGKINTVRNLNLPKWIKDEKDS